MYQLVNFKAVTTCVVETIDIDALRELEKNHIPLRDILKKLEIDILQGEKSDLDFFRFMPPRSQNIKSRVRKLIRKKFRERIV